MQMRMRRPVATRVTSAPQAEKRLGHLGQTFLERLGEAVRESPEFAIVYTLLSFDAFQIGPRPRVDLEHVAGIDVERNVDGRARLEFRRFGRAAADRVALHAGVGLRDLQLDEGRQLVAERLVLRDEGHDLGLVLEELACSPSDAMGTSTCS